MQNLYPVRRLFLLHIVVIVIIARPCPPSLYRLNIKQPSDAESKQKNAADGVRLYCLTHIRMPMSRHITTEISKWNTCMANRLRYACLLVLFYSLVKYYVNLIIKLCQWAVLVALRKSEREIVMEQVEMGITVWTSIVNSWAYSEKWRRKTNSSIAPCVAECSNHPFLCKLLQECASSHQRYFIQC